MIFFRKRMDINKIQPRRILAVTFLVLFGGMMAVFNQSVYAQPLKEPPANSATADAQTATQAPVETANANSTAYAAATAFDIAQSTNTAYAATLTSNANVFYPIKVVINEIAWMGTKTNTSSEWIELFNPENAPVNMAGWMLISKTSSFSITLTGSISAHSYYLLERNDDNTIIDIKADQIYNADGLSDNGEYLQLIDNTGIVIDTANRLGGKWPAGNGNKSIACSMERAGYNYPDDPKYWITNSGLVINGKDAGQRTICGTPKNINWAYSVTATPTRTITPTRTPIPPFRPSQTREPTKTPRYPHTPTRNPFATPPSIVVINEFLSQPHSDWNNDGKIDTGDEFIEIMNLGIRPVNLSGWSLDDQPGDSLPYTIGNISIEPKARLAFYKSQTGILLGSSGDSVRLIGSTGQIWDAFTYGLVSSPDQSWCRLPDGFGLWRFGCAPTPKESNKLAESVFLGNRIVSSICLSTKLPPGIGLAECDYGGASNWGTEIWNDDSEYLRFLEQGSDTFILD